MVRQRPTTGSAEARTRELFVADIPLGSDGQPKIRKLLIANRGEIACRIIATCRKLNVQSVAVFAQEDSLSRHVVDADEAICIGKIESSATNPFLDIELLVKTAVDTGAQAIHPGYGYLSENPHFADRVRAAGLIFVGPSGSAISTLGDKRSSKEYLRANAPDVPLIPGFAGSSNDTAVLGQEARKIGFPVMLKASAGGGGKGMRIVRAISELGPELDRAQSEAQHSFGSSDCILEKFIENSKHVEIQVVGDKHGHIVSFFERDCSIQRRNQKVIEETPCLFLTPETRKKMSRDAIRIVSLIGYEGAGTVEFVFDTESMLYYFLEVNTRLQVEHPITEEVVGVDLVALQLFVAAEGRLADLPALSNLTQAGHAIECRLCAEDPRRGFFPSHDDVLLWRPASPGRTAGSVVRYETAMRSQTSVSIHFDSMICKIVVWAPTRAQAVARLAKELAHTACMGVKTNQLFLQSCLLHPAFQKVGYKTSFVKDHLEDLLKNPHQESIPDYAFIIPSLFLRSMRLGVPRPARGAFSGIRAHFHNQSYDPFDVGCEVISLKASGDAPGGDYSRSEVCLSKPARSSTDENEAIFLHSVPRISSEQQNNQVAAKEVASPAQELTSEYNAISRALRQGKAWSGPAHKVSGITLRSALSGASISPFNRGQAASIEFFLGRQRVRAYLALPHFQTSSESPDFNHRVRVLCHLPSLGEWVEFHRDTLLSFCTSRRKAVGGATDNQSVIKAPMPCKILSIAKKCGDQVAPNDTVMVIESMKMEINILVQLPGVFQTRWNVGDAVNEGTVLCSVE